jgi:flagellar hook-length control protein FliK
VPTSAANGGGDAANATSSANANATNNGSGSPANATATPGPAADGGTDTANSTTIAAAFNAAVNANGPAAANSVTPAAPKTPGGKDQPNDATADPTSDSSTAPQAQASPSEAAQPIAAAVNNLVTDAASPMAKAGLTLADGKVRTKAIPAVAQAGQNTPARENDTDPAASASTTESGGTDGSTATASDATTGNSSTSTMSAQQTPDQSQAPGATSAALLSQIDFASSDSAERLGLHGGATASLNSAGVGAAPAATGNTTVVPNFGVFAASAMTGGTAPAAAGSETAVPLAGLAVAIAGRAQAGSSQFDIRLDPPELGRIDVRLGVDGSGQVTTHVTVDRADTLQLLQSQQPQLQQALEQAGLKTADNGLQFTLRDQSFAGQNGGSNSQQQPAPPTPLVIPESDSAPIDTAQIYARLRLGNGLDIRV